VAGFQTARVALDQLSAPAATPVATPTTVAASDTRTRQRPLFPAGPRRDQATRTGDVRNCSEDHPRFQGGLADLKRSLGRIMGEPLECERVVNGEGDTEQHTSTGLAYYLKALNVPGVHRWTQPLGSDGPRCRLLERLGNQPARLGFTPVTVTLPDQERSKRHGQGLAHRPLRHCLAAQGRQRRLQLLAGRSVTG
jgi:hypothetical protein